MKTIAIALLTMVVFVGAGLGGEPDDRQRENPKDPTKYTREHRLVFYAVLEGLFEDGVAGEALELIIPDADGMWVEGHPEKTNFVYACPLCTPTFDAFRLYMTRRPFYAQKGTRYTTFGPGLAEEVVARLRGAPQERRDAIEELIAEWVGRRLDAMALTGAERAAIEKNLEEMKKDGEEMLKTHQSGEKGEKGEIFNEVYTGWKKCSICEGAAGAALHAE